MHHHDDTSFRFRRYINSVLTVHHDTLQFNILYSYYNDDRNNDMIVVVLMTHGDYTSNMIWR